jgi:hypothetical protein
MDNTAFSEIVQKPLDQRTDKELELTKIYLQRDANASLRSLQKNLQFFFWLTIISIVIALLAYAISES